MDSKWTSRKFLLAVAAQIAALLALVLGPEQADAIAPVLTDGAAVIASAIAAWAYIAGESRIDAERVKQGSGRGNVRT